MPRVRNGAPELSGAPDTTDEPVEDAKPVEKAPAGTIWDADNRLVDPELDEHFKAASEAALGTGRVDAEKASTAALNAQKSQMSVHQTADPMTSPQPSSDPNQRPSLLGVVGEPAEAGDGAASLAEQAMQTQANLTGGKVHDEAEDEPRAENDLMQELRDAIDPASTDGALDSFRDSNPTGEPPTGEPPTGESP